MHIEIGQCYTNKTWRFLLPSVKGHGDIFIRKFNPVFKLAVGIHDTLVDDSKIAEGRNIYILCDKLINEKNFNEFLEYVKYQDYYVADYCPDSEILKSRKHMIVIRIPEIFHDAYDYFLTGDYSQMYLDNELKILFSSSIRQKEYDILTRTSKELKEFVIKVNKDFGTSAKEEDFKFAELELPLVKKEEIFNCEDSCTVYFNEKIDKVWQ